MPFTHKCFFSLYKSYDNCFKKRKKDECWTLDVGLSIAMVMENVKGIESGVVCQVRYEEYKSMEGESLQMTILKWVGRSVMKFVITRSKFTNICNFLMTSSYSLFPSVQLEICMFNCRKRCRKQQAYSIFHCYIKSYVLCVWKHCIF